MQHNKQVTIAVSAALFDAGEATRSLQLAKGIRDYAPEGYYVRFVFLSNGGTFERNVSDAGFEVAECSPRLEGSGFHSDLKPRANNFVGSPELARALLEGEKKALEECRPDAVLYGFWPFASLAARMAVPKIPRICFLPIPLEAGIYASGLMTDVPDQIRPLTFLPAGVRRKLMKALPASLKLKAPVLRQKNILDAARRCGWNEPELGNLFDMMKSDVTVVNDLPLFYRGIRLPAGFHVTGPLYSQPDSGAEPDAAILRVMGNKADGRKKLFCSLGSSGTEEMLLEAVKAIASLPEKRFAAVILVPKAVCPLEAVLPFVNGRSNLAVTDRFVPAKLVNGLADLVVSHGGQGTVQTAMACGTPIVGFAVQPEQQINLDHVVSCGACVRIPAARWKAKNIRKAVLKVAGDASYRRSAEKLAESMSRIDGRAESARVIWNFIREKGLGREAGNS